MSSEAESAMVLAQSSGAGGATRLERRPMSREEFDALPEGVRAEYVGGVALMSPPPHDRHNAVGFRLARLLSDALPGVEVLYEVGIEMAHSLRIADVAVSSRARRPVVGGPPADPCRRDACPAARVARTCFASRSSTSTRGSSTTGSSTRTRSPSPPRAVRRRAEGAGFVESALINVEHRRRHVARMFHPVDAWLNPLGPASASADGPSCSRARRGVRRVVRRTADAPLCTSDPRGPISHLRRGHEGPACTPTPLAGLPGPDHALSDLRDSDGVGGAA